MADKSKETTKEKKNPLSQLTSHLVMVSRGYILNVRLEFGSSIRIPSRPTWK